MKFFAAAWAVWAVVFFAVSAWQVVKDVLKGAARRRAELAKVPRVTYLND